MKFSHTSPYKLQDSNLTYDTLQYQELMKNFENLIKVTQEKMNQNHFSLEQSCQCTLEEQLQELQQENEQLRDYIKKQCEIDSNTMKIMKESGNLMNQQQITQLINEFAQKSEQQNHLIQELQDQLQSLQNQLHQEKNSHKATCMKFEEEFTKQKNERAFQNYKELEVNEKITKGFQELIDENQDYKQINKKLTKQIENQKIALNQAYLVMSKNKNPPISIAERKHQQSQTDDDLFTKTEILKERLQNQVQNLDKFIITYIEKKLQRNKSANEVKFYTSLNNWIQQIKNESLTLKQVLQQIIDEKQQLCAKLKQTENQLEINEEKYNNEQFQIQEHWKNEYLKNQELIQSKNELEQTIQEINKQLNQKNNENKQMSLQINSLKEENEKLNLEVNSYDTQYKFIVENFEKEKTDYLILLDSEKQKSKAIQVQFELKNKELIDIKNKHETLFNQESSASLVQFEQITQLNKTLNERDEEIKYLTLNQQENQIAIEQLKSELNNLQNQHNQHNQSIQSAYELLEEENQQLQTYCKQLQSDIRDRNMQLSDYRNQISDLETQLYQNQIVDKSQLENTYMSSKIDDLESILKEKDQKIEEIEKLYHLTSYELRLLQDYQQSLENDVNSYKSKVAKLETELDISNVNCSKGQNVSFLQEESTIFQQQQKIKALEDQIQQLTSFTTIDLKSQKANQQNQPQIQVKILSGEISRLNQTISLLQMKVQDLQFFIEKMITANEANRLLATQILVQASQQGKILEQNLNLQDDNIKKTDSFQSGETFGFTVQSLTIKNKKFNEKYQ